MQNDDPFKALSLLNEFEEKLETLSLEQRILYYKLIAEILSDQAQYQKSNEAANKGLLLTKKLTSPSILIAELLYVRGFTMESLGDMEGATQDYLNGLDLAESLNDNVYISYGLTNLGAIYYLSERFERSIIVLNDAYKIANKTNDEELKGYVTSELGILYAQIGQYDKSLVFYEQSYQHYIKAGKLLNAYNSLRNKGANLSQNKRYEEAIEVYKTIIASADKIVNNELLYAVYSDLAWANIKKEDDNPEAAYQYLLISDQYIVDAQQHDVLLYHFIRKAYILDSLQKYDEALDSLVEAELLNSKQKKQTNTWLYADLLDLKANIYNVLGKYDEAYKIKSQVVDLITELREKENVTEIQDLRLRYESEQADLLKELLKDKETLHNVELEKASKATENQQTLVTIISIFALVFAWFLIKLIQGQKRFIKASRTDGLTGIVNRRRLLQLGEVNFSKATQKQLPLSLLMIDLDNFKEINDSLGHKIGDKVLKKTAKLISATMRKTDVFGRFGGEEFIVFLPDTEIKQANVIAERLRQAVFEHQWRSNDLKEVTVSVGLVVLDPQKHNRLNDLIKAADEKLYIAKREGRNKVCS